MPSTTLTYTRCILAWLSNLFLIALDRPTSQDVVPKALMHFLVNTVQRGMQQHLIRTLYRWVGGRALPVWVRLFS